MVNFTFPRVSSLRRELNFEVLMTFNFYDHSCRNVFIPAKLKHNNKLKLLLFIEKTKILFLRGGDLFLSNNEYNCFSPNLRKTCRQI